MKKYKVNFNDKGAQRVDEVYANSTNEAAQRIKERIGQKSAAVLDGSQPCFRSGMPPPEFRGRRPGDPVGMAVEPNPRGVTLLALNLMHPQG